MIAKSHDERKTQATMMSASNGNAVRCEHCGEVLLRDRPMVGPSNRWSASTRIVCVSCNHAMMVRL